MSANNQLLIFKIKGEYCVFENHRVDNKFRKPRSSRKALYKSDNLLEATLFANDYCNKNIVEYGFSVVI